MAKLDAADAGAHLRSELEQLEANESRRRHRRTGCGADRRGARYRREHRPWPRTTCGADWPAWWPMRRGRRTARTASANAVLGLAAGAVEILIESTRVTGDAGALERGDDEARIGAVRCVLGLAYNTPGAAPAVDRAIPEAAEHPAPAGPRRSISAAPPRRAHRPAPLPGGGCAPSQTRSRRGSSLHTSPSARRWKSRCRREE